MTSPSPFLTTQEVADRWRAKPAAVHNAIWSGELIATKPAGRWLIKVEHVEAYERAKQNGAPLPKRRRLPRRRIPQRQPGANGP